MNMNIEVKENKYSKFILIIFFHNNLFGFSMNDKIIEIFNALDEKMKELGMPWTIDDNTTTDAGGSRDQSAANDAVSGGSHGQSAANDAARGGFRGQGAANDAANGGSRGQGAANDAVSGGSIG